MAASAPPGQAAAARPAAPADLARQSLGRVITQYGLEVCADPWRCEALLRDLCGGCRREIFWLVSALKENVVADIKGSLGTVSDPVLVARLAHKMADNLGLSPAPAQWAAETWLEAVRLAPASASAPDLAHMVRTDLPAWPNPEAVASITASLPPGLDRRWLGLCLGGIGATALAFATILRVAFHAATLSPRGWLIDTGLLAAGLALSALIEFGVASGLARWPLRCRPTPARAPWALAPEALLLLLQPAVPVVGPLLWFAAWYGAWRYSPTPPDFAFHLGRTLQSLLLLAFCAKWVVWMTRVQGRVAATMVRLP